MGKSILHLEDINKIYFGAVENQVLFDINLSVKRGSFNAIIGQSGSGKSTLLNIIGTLMKPTSGRLFIDGVETVEMTKEELAELRNQKLGFIFQYHYLLDDFTALENTLMPIKIYRSVTEVDRNRAKELIDLVGMKDLYRNKTNQLSGGQRQRVAIARALMNNPDIVLADEPTGNLDSKTSESVFKLFKKVNSEFKTTFIIVTHDQKIAESTNRIIEVIDGKIEG